MQSLLGPGKKQEGVVLILDVCSFQHVHDLFVLVWEKALNVLFGHIAHCRDSLLYCIYVIVPCSQLELITITLHLACTCILFNLVRLFLNLDSLHILFYGLHFNISWFHFHVHILCIRIVAYWFVPTLLCFVCALAIIILLL